MRLVGIIAVGIACSAMAACSREEAPPPPRPTRVVDLSPPLSETLVRKQYGKRATDFFGLNERSAITTVRPPDASRTYGFAYFDIMSHAGAHLDASARLLRDGLRPVEVPLEKLYGWARVLDLRWHDRSSPITITDLENYRIHGNEIILLNTGFETSGNNDWPQYAYLSPQAAQWLAALGIPAIGTDTPSLGSLREIAAQMEKGAPPEEVWSTHIPFFKKDIPVIEGLVNLTALLGERRVFFAGFPLPVADRSGAPVRAVGLVFE